MNIIPAICATKVTENRRTFAAEMRQQNEQDNIMAHRPAMGGSSKRTKWYGHKTDNDQ